MNLKSQLHLSNRKAYLQIDFAFVVLIFFLLFFLVHSLYKQKENSIDESIILNGMQADARDLCFLLSSSSGYPTNWDEDILSTSVFGLKGNGTGNLSFKKIEAFNGTSNYFSIMDNLEYGEDFNMKIIGLSSGLEYINFGSDIEIFDVYFAKSICYSNYNGEMVKIVVEVWQ